jgi:HK97 family phage prohead protease
MDGHEKNTIIETSKSASDETEALIPNSEERPELKASAQREHLQVPFEIKQVQNEDPDFFVFEGYASTFNNVDLGDDIVMPGAFRDSLSRKSFKILWQHDMKMPLGVPIEAFEDNKGLFIKAKLPKEDSFVSERVIPQLKVGSIDSMSIGFVVEDFEFDKNVRKILKVNLFEVSLVTMPMNPEAAVTAFKAEDESNETKISPTEGNKDISEAEVKSVTDVACMKDVELILKERGGFSGSERKTLISKIKDFSKQRDVASNCEDETRDAEIKEQLLNEFNKTINHIKGL